MAPAPDPKQGTFQESLDKLSGALFSITGNFNDLATRAANLPATPGGGHVGVPAPRGGSGEPPRLGEARELVQAAVDRGTEIQNRAKSVIELFPTARNWTDQIQSPVSALVADPRGTEAGRFLHLWTGPAATEYGFVLIRQKEAVTALGTLASNVSLWLSAVAAANVTYMVDTALVHVEQATKLANTVAGGLSNVSVFGIVATIIDIATELGSRQTKIDGAGAKQLADSLTLANQAQTFVNKNDGFPNAQWPNSVSFNLNG